MADVKRICANCLYFDLVRVGEHNAYGLCRRHAPFAREKQGPDPAKAQWPRVTAHLDWCGEFELR